MYSCNKIVSKQGAHFLQRRLTVKEMFSKKINVSFIMGILKNIGNIFCSILKVFMKIISGTASPLSIDAT